MEQDTKTRILDAAEHVFAERGFKAASIRHIIAAAGVNLAAIHYHFGSKEALIAEVFSRRIQPLNAERLRRLDEVERKAGAKKLPLEPVIESFVTPALRLAHDGKSGGAAVMRLFGRVIAEPSAELEKLITAQFGEVVKRFMAAFGRALPELPETVLFWRFQFVIGSMAHVMCAPGHLERISRGACDTKDTERLVRELVCFLAAGMKARAGE